jgi:protein involved in polysaccharide export with SLBB domain
LKQNSTDLIGLVSLMSDITDSEPAGRLVAELNPNLISRSPIQDLDLEGGDIIYMPPIQNTVTVVGQVLNPVTVPYSESLRSNDYVKFAGGFQTEADKKRMYIILPNGKSAPVSMSILERGPFSKNNILPGSTIIIPRKSRPMDSLALVETISPIIASLSVTAASIAAIQD